MGRGDEREIRTVCGSPAANIVRHRQRGAPIQKDFDDLVVVPVSGEDQWRDVRRECRGVRWQRFPALKHRRGETRPRISKCDDYLDKKVVGEIRGSRIQNVTI